MLDVQCGNVFRGSLVLFPEQETGSEIGRDLVSEAEYNLGLLLQFFYACSSSSRQGALSLKAFSITYLPGLS